MNELAEKSRKYNPPLKEVYSATGDKTEERRAKAAMERFVTDPEGAVYALTPYVPELFAALLKARYSRTELSAKQLLWREFVSEKTDIPWKKIDQGIEALQKVFDYQRAEAMAGRVLLQFGDDSVLELGGLHLFFDRVSQVAAKVIEDSRIGISPLEKSTRYVVFDQKGPDGDYAFFKDLKLMDSSHRDLYLHTNRNCFEFYTESVARLQDHFRAQIPLESQQCPDLSQPGLPLVSFTGLKDEKSLKAARIAYNQSIRSKACDIARVLLPASTLTNIGEFGNARAFGYLMIKLLSSPLAEMQMLGSEGIREMKKILPKFFDVVDNNHGEDYQKYLRQTEATLRTRTNELLKGVTPEESQRVALVEMDKNPEINIVAALLYPYTDLPLQQLVNIVREMNPTLAGDILHDSLKFRTNRRHKPPRAFEVAGYELVFDVIGNFGIYRDLQRQRMLTQTRQLYTTDHGYDMPLEFAEVGLDTKFRQLMDQVKSAHDNIGKDFPLESQYVTSLGNYMRWYMGMNLREAFWVTELRSIPQGHFSYRTIAQEMFVQAQKRYPFLKDLKAGQQQYVNSEDYSKNLERLSAMQNIEKKLAQIEEKYS